MSEKKNDTELSLDELDDVSGGVAALNPIRKSVVKGRPQISMGAAEMNASVQIAKPNQVQGSSLKPADGLMVSSERELEPQGGQQKPGPGGMKRSR